MSRKKHVLNVAASSGLSGGVSRVFTGPAKGTFAINASAQIAPLRDELDMGSCFIQMARSNFLNSVQTTAQNKLTIIPLTIAKVHIDAASMPATFQFVDLIIVSSEGRLTDGPAISNATAAPIGAPELSNIRASGISKNVGNANGTARAATTTMARNLAAVESNVRTGII